jgi:Domain of unknown function (DUF4398)
MSPPIPLIKHAALKYAATAAAAVAVLATASCSSEPKPTADLAGAHTLVAQAEQSGAQQYASADLEAARSELRQADQDAKDKPVLSMRLAQESSVDAELALAHTRALKAEESLRQVNSGTATLQSESERARPQPVDAIPPSGAPMPQYQ